MHWYVNFHDPVADPDHEPTVFEWAGGLPALTRLTRLFYEKYVPQDPLIGPLFANMSPDHPERVAAWLGEVFGGPKNYTQAYGGYTRMLTQHLGKGLTEEQRARWASLLYQAANEAGLPNDPEFRSAFTSYIEWGSRVAVENSQPGSHPPQNMPVPRWDWGTAGPPGSRVSALSPSSSRRAGGLRSTHQAAVSCDGPPVDGRGFRPVVLPGREEPCRWHSPALAERVDAVRRGVVPREGGDFPKVGRVRHAGVASGRK